MTNLLMNTTCSQNHGRRSLHMIMLWAGLLACLLALSLAHAQTTPRPKSVTLQGTLTNFPPKVELEDFSDLNRIVPTPPERLILLNKDSTFSISFPLESPCYFRLGRNILYLSPGDAITAHLDLESRTRGRFTGRGSVPNNYLCDMPFPKGGSYLSSGANLKATPKETFEFIQRAAQERTDKLNSLTNVSPEFRTLEMARIRADTFISMLKVRTYAGMVLAREPAEKQKAYLEEFTQLAKPIQDKLLHDFVDPTFLQVEPYRDIYRYLDLESATNNPAGVQQMKAWNAAVALTARIRMVSDKSELAKFKPDIEAISTPRYRDALQIALNEKLKFGIGDLAADFTAEDSQGKSVKLSSLRGKVIYVDIWATWCGPCMAEMPKLEELKKRYETNEGLAIVSLSIDEKLDAWKRNLETRQPGGIQWRINRAELSQYQIQGIPRCLLIDRNFRVVDLDAPHPSSPAITNVLDGLLSKAAGSESNH